VKKSEDEGRVLSWFEDEAYFLFFFGWKTHSSEFYSYPLSLSSQRSVFFPPSIGLSSILATRWCARAWSSRIEKKDIFGFKPGNMQPTTSRHIPPSSKSSSRRIFRTPTCHSFHQDIYPQTSPNPSAHWCICRLPAIDRHDSMHEAATSATRSAANYTRPEVRKIDPSHIDISPRRDIKLRNLAESATSAPSRAAEEASRTLLKIRPP